MSAEAELITREFIVEGTVLMLKEILQNLVDKEGFFLHAERVESDVSAHLALLLRAGEAVSQLGYIRLTALPRKRVEIYLSNEAVWETKKVDLDGKVFSRFCQDLYKELKRLGIAILEGKDKPPIGFRKER